MEPRNISNSEVTSWLSCRQQYYWNYYLNLTPKVEATALTRGSMGHEAFQRYSEARIDGKSHDDAMRFANDVFTRGLQATGNVEMVLHLKTIFQNYMGFHQGWPDLKVLSVEQRHEIPLNDDFKMVIRYDTLVEERTTGKRLIGDYKFTYDFWTPEEHALNGQMPKYIAVLRANGFHIDGGFLEQLRTRKLSKDNQKNPKMAWRRHNYFPSALKQKNMLRQHIAAGLEIMEYRNLSDADREAKSIPVLNKYGACAFCDFKEVCASKLDGGDVQVFLDTAFVQNTYGYNHEQEEVKELL